MPAIIPNFEHDVFISYRHNDNRSGWVTEFVRALQEELAATLKDPVSVYFDTNPHDGLLETHNVDKSLEGKLNCLIFIPIISQTYCDQKSFAWQHEFCAFNKLAKEDQFGRDITLSNGNVASRILPVKIHELDAEDKAILQNELGGVLRAIEFIYKEAGVNRPLKSADNKNENQNRTDYRNQMNKIANAVKEIIQGILKPTSPVKASSQEAPALNTHPNKTKESIAVLPFANMSNDPDQEYFSDGMAEEILNSLVHIKDLKVAGRTSSFQFKGKNIDLREVGNKLGVSTVLEGSVRKQGNRLRVTAQLINVEDGFHLWSEKYDRNMDDIFAIQDEIALAITNNLKLILTEQEHKRIRYAHTTNQEAYDLYLKGRFCWNNRTEKWLKKGADYFNQAITKDPEYVLAYSGLADTYNMLGFYSLVSPKDAFPMAQSLALKALHLDETLAEAHCSLAFGKLYYYWDWVASEKEFRRSLELNSGYATARHWYSEYLALTGRADEALEEAKKALESDPLSLIINTLMGWVHYYSRNYDQAIFRLKKTLELAPNFSPAFLWLGLSYGKKSQFTEAFSTFQEALNLSESSSIVVAASGIVKAQSGDVIEAQNIIDELKIVSGKRYVSPYFVAAIYAALGNTEQTFEWLEKAYNEHDIWLTYINVDPVWDNIRLDKRFDVILKTMNLLKQDF